MKIIFYGMLDKIINYIAEEPLLIVTPYRLREYSNISYIRQLVVEDIGLPEFRSPIYKGYESIIYVYKLASYFLKNFDFDADYLTLVINGETGFDLGVSLKILEMLSKNPHKYSATIIVQVPKTSSPDNVLSRFYAFYKLLLLYDLYFNLKKRGSLRVLFFKPDLSSYVLFKLSMLYDVRDWVENTYSLLDVSFGIYKIPLNEAYGFLDSLLMKGKVEYKIKELKLIGSMLNRILDEAPPEVWEKARKYKSFFKKVKTSIVKLNNLNKKIEDKIKEYMLSIKTRRGNDYIYYIGDMREIIELLLNGYSESDLVSKVGLKAIFEKINESLLKSLKTVSGYSVVYKQGLKTWIITGRLFDSIIKEINIPSNVMIYSGTDKRFISKYEMLIVKNYLVPLCSKCPVKEYLPSKFRQTYESHIGLTIESHYPEKIVIGDKILFPEEVYKLRPISYAGLEYLIKNDIELDKEFNIVSKLK